MTEKHLKPLVYWAQNEGSVFLTIGLRVPQPDNPDVEFEVHEKGLRFSGEAEGAQGLNYYEVELDSYGTVDLKKSGYAMTDRSITACLVKSNPTWWPRLTDKVIKLPWLKIDFDRWQDPQASSSEDESSTRQWDPDAMEYCEKNANMDFDMSPGKRLRHLLDSTKEPIRDFAGNVMGINDVVEKAKTYRAKLLQWYLVLYNLALFVGYFLIVGELIHGFVVMDTKYFEHVWHRVSPKLKCCVMMQFFEFLHGLLGFTKTNPIASLMQTGGRATILFLVLGGEPRMHDKPMVFYVFIVWSLVEIFRYPYYALAVGKIEWGWVTWLRYSMWIPLYPLGFLCEGTILVRSIPFYQETQTYSFPLPNRANFGFDFAAFEMCFLLFGFMPTIVYLIGHMRQQRRVKLRRHHVELQKKAD